MTLLGFTIFALVLASPPALCAEPANDAPLAFQASNQSPAEAKQAASIARATTGGRVLDVRPLQNDSPSAFRVRLLIDPGRVRTVIVDADSGLIR